MKVKYTEPIVTITIKCTENEFNSFNSAIFEVINGGGSFYRDFTIEQQNVLKDYFQNIENNC